MDALRACVVLVTAAAHLQVARADLGVVPVAPPPGPDGELVEIARELRQRFAEQRPHVVEARELRDRMLGRASAAALAELERAHDAARAAYVKGDYEASARTLRSILERLEALPDGAEPFAQWTRAMLRLARTELTLGHDAAARDVLDRLVRAAPHVEVDRTLYPASFAKAVERARAAARAAPTRTLAVTSSAAGARVFVNGREVGTAPVRLALPSGRYRISGAVDELRAEPVLVELGEDREVLLDFSMRDWLRPDAGPGLAASSDEVARLARPAGARLRVEELVLVSLLDDEGATFAVGSLYDAADGARTREGRVRLHGRRLPAGGSRALAEYLVTGEVPSRMVEVPGAPPDLAALPPSGDAVVPAIADAGRPDATAAPRRGRALGWAALGSGVASVGLAAVGIAETRAARARYDDARQLERTDSLVTLDAVRSYNRLVAQGDEARRNARIAWVASGTGAVATGVLGYLNYRRTGEFGPFRF